MSSFLIPLTDALMPQALGAELPQPPSGGLDAFSASASFQELFPDLLAGLASSTDGDSPTPSPDPKPSFTQVAFPVAEACRRLHTPTTLLAPPSCRQCAESDNPPAPPFTVPVSLPKQSLPIWTASALSVLGDAGNIEVEEAPVEAVQPEDTDVKSTGTAGLFLMPQTMLPHPAARMPVVHAFVPPLVTAGDAGSDVPAEIQIEVPEQQTLPSVKSASRQEDDTEREQPEAATVPDSDSLLTLPQGSPEKPPSLPNAPHAPESKRTEAFSDHAVGNRAFPSGQDDPTQMAALPNRWTRSNEGERASSYDAFRLLLRNYGLNSPAQPAMPLAMEPPNSGTFSTLEAAPMVPKPPAPPGERSQGADAALQSSDLAQPTITKTLAHIPTARTGAKPVLTESTSETLPASQSETSSAHQQLPAAGGPDTGRKQSDRNSQGREDERQDRNSLAPEPSSKSVILPSRDVSNAHVELGRLAIESDVRSELSPQTAPVTEEQAPIAPPSRTVQQIRVSLPPSTDGPNVEVLLNQRAGGVEVSVRSPDAQVRETLRSGLADLIGSFDRKGVSAETLPLTIPGHSPQAGHSQGLAEAAVGKSLSPQNAVVTLDGENRGDPQQHQHQQRQGQWEAEGDNRRRRDQSPDAWQRYMEENAWRSL